MGNLQIAANTFDAFKPTYWFIKAIGLWVGQYEHRQKYPFSILSLIHVSLILIINIGIFYLNGDPRPFLRLTNTTIINYGLWLQTECAMLLSILFIIGNMMTHRFHSEVMCKYVCVDRELKVNFSVYAPFGLYKKLSCIIIAIFYIEIVGLTYIEYCYLSAIPNLSSTLLFTICASIYLTNLYLVSTLLVFVSSCQYLMRRCHCVNKILEQLLTNEPLSNEYEFVNRSRTFADDFKYMNQNGQSRWTALPPNAVGPFSIFKVQNRQLTPPPPYQAMEKLNRTMAVLPANRLRINTWATSMNRIGYVNNDRLNAMYDSANENTIWDPEIDKFVSMLPLYKIGLLRRIIISHRVFTKDSDSEYVIRKLDQLFRIYINLIDCYDLLNLNLSKQILLMIATSSVFLLFGLFTTFRVYMDYQKDADAATHALLILVFSGLITALIPAILISTAAMNKAKETSKIISRIAYGTSDPRLLVKLLEISRKLYARRPIIGCGFVAFDGKIVLSFVATICMQLIMLIQFYLSFQNV